MGKSAKAKKSTKTQPVSVLFYLFTGFLILFLPLFHLPSALDEAMQPRLLAVAVLLFTVCAWYLRPASKFQVFDTSILKKRVFLFLLVYYLTCLISLASAINVRQGFYDISKTGITLVLIVFAVLIIDNTENWGQKLSKLVIIIASVSILVGAFQYYQYVIMATTERLPNYLPLIYAVKGLSFHKNDFSAAMLFMIPFMLFAGITMKNRWGQFAWVILALLLFLILILKTRSVWIGILVGSFISVSLLIVFYKKFSLTSAARNQLLIGMIAFISLLAVLFIVPKPADETSFFGRLRSVTDPASTDNIYRLKVWEATGTMIREKPLTGYGAGNWEIQAPAHFKSMFQSVEQINWTRPHNDFLWIWSEKGIVSLLVYLSIFALLFYYLLMIIRKTESSHHRMLALTLSGMLTAYLIIAFFNFPYERIENQVMLALITAAIIVMYHATQPDQKLRISRYAILLPGLILAGTSILYGMAAIAHESHIRKAIEARNREQYESTITEAEKVDNRLTSLDPMSYPAEFYSGMAYAKLNRHLEAVAALKKALSQSPYNLWINDQLGQSYFMLGKYDESKACVEKVLDIMPRYYAGLRSLAAIHFQKGEYKLALKAMLKIPGWKKDKDIRQGVKILREKIGEGKPSSKAKSKP